MKRKQLGINEQYEVPVLSGALNPNLKNTFTRIINIDVQFYTQTKCCAIEFNERHTLWAVVCHTYNEQRAFVVAYEIGSTPNHLLTHL